MPLLKKVDLSDSRHEFLNYAMLEFAIKDLMTFISYAHAQEPKHSVIKVLLATGHGIHLFVDEQENLCIVNLKIFASAYV